MHSRSVLECTSVGCMDLGCIRILDRLHEPVRMAASERHVVLYFQDAMSDGWLGDTLNDL